MSAQPEQRDVSRRSVTGLYAVLLVVTVVVLGLVLGTGGDRKTEKAVAGTYTVAPASSCLGKEFELKQSGQFINLGTPKGGSPSARAKLDGDKVTGDVKCVKGGDGKLDVTVADGRLTGTAAGEQFESTLTGDPPPPGAKVERAPDSVAGEYALSPRSACLGGKLEIEEKGSGFEVTGGKVSGEARYSDGVLSGEVECPETGTAELEGEAKGRKIDLVLASSGGTEEKLTAQETRKFGETLAVFFLAVVVVMLAARLFGALAVRIGQPRVMGEVVSGITLGPTILGAVLPDLQGFLFPQDVLPFIGVVANLGLIFYMFLVGLELDPAQLRGRVGQAAAISNASVALPMVLGVVVAVPVYGLVAPPGTKFLAFALYMGVAMSITAFPVLARILVERRMLKRPVGALALACAAIDDVTAWVLIALATTVAVAGSASAVVKTMALAVAFCLLMGFAVRPLLARVSEAYDEAGRVPPGWIAAIFAGILLSAYTTEEIGIALIFGAFIMGMIMPRRAELTEDVTRRVEDFVVTLLLPLFFAYTGLRTDIGLLDRPELWLLTVALIAIAIVGKLVGAMIAARITGFDWRSSTVIGVLMNTRGLTELIVLNLALEAGVISEALFAALVIMALVTTFMAGPALKLLDPRNELGAPVEEELVEARERATSMFPALQVPERSILVAPQSGPALEQLLAIARPLARSQPPRELILARLLQPPRGAGVRGGLQTENKLLAEAATELLAVRDQLMQEGVAAREVATISANTGGDLARLARSEEVDLVLIDGRRPLLGEGVPRGDVGVVLQTAPSDVAVLVTKEGEALLTGGDRSIIVPFGGAEHDWAALELAAWLGSTAGMPIKLLGAAGQSDESRVTRLLGDAGLLVQHYDPGVSAQPLMAEPGREGVLEAAAGAGILIIGLSERWREEGLGETRSDIARAAPGPVLFVRRGTRPGALAPAGNVTQFGWSSAGA
ncbi:MAG: cation:proton antiporter [Actinomycetota bacterium]